MLFSLDASPLTMACQLVSCASVTPSDGGIFDELIELFRASTEQIFCLQWQDTKNLYIRWGTKAPHLCFAGHVDVVPPGPQAQWSFPAFHPTHSQGWIYGRGIADMKGAIGCFLHSLWNHLKTSPQNGSYSILLTSDEEGPGVNGIQKMIPWLQEKQEKIDHILIGEPTGNFVGEVLQIGRRGSITGTLTYPGIQGHIAYPDLCDNPMPRFVQCLFELVSKTLDEGDENFESSRFNLIGIEPPAIAMNVSPSYAKAQFGIRFNPYQNFDSVSNYIHHVCKKHGNSYVLDLTLHGSSFLTQDVLWIECASNAISHVTGLKPKYTTRGGTTDGRFLKNLAPVLEIGMPEATIHQIDERVKVSDFHDLSSIYTRLLQEYDKTYSKRL
ncbi:MULTISPECIES: succinyl-diaminopimelate desuccinylase [Holospora]|uniref:Succinyl-diaminopimelate desuccinylase n=2 Tax=Holospora TaxID=44747 RepID=A0A061JH09_9PROT|nr:MULTISPECIES: succinyl-diaminopimelate desuccinylase [Holospora]ETZ05405.1 succinyl-diaminopimelate desuccinylase [Holospora undulata HU1]GAJ46044.1 succinyl-diaminopimelate desuccinylase [Holospora elegans E1]